MVLHSWELHPEISVEQAIACLEKEYGLYANYGVPYPQVQEMALKALLYYQESTALLDEKLEIERLYEQNEPLPFDDIDNIDEPDE